MKLFTLTNVHFKNIIHYPTMEIKAKQTTFICGASGTGKSTLLKLLNGVLSPSGGRITYAGEDIAEYDPITLRREVLFVGQAVYLFDQSIQDNFRTYYAYRDRESPSEAEMRRYLDICAVSLPLGSMCDVLSGGERQRVFIAINLSLAPNVLMMDEPTSALDDKNAAMLIENVQAHCARHGVTLLVVSHDKAIAERYADRVVLLEGGATYA